MRRPSMVTLAVVFGLVVGAAALAAGTEKTSYEHGKVTFVDVKQRTISLKTEAGKVETFQLTDESRITGAGDKTLAVADVRVGEAVGISYSMRGETRWANHVTVKTSESAKNRPAAKH